MPAPVVAPTYLVGYDGTASGRAAVRFATALAAETGAAVIAGHVHVVHPQLLAGGDEGRWTGLERDEAEALLRGLAAELDGAITTRAVAGASPAQGMHELAIEVGADLLVVGPHRAASGRTTGSTARALLHGAPCPLAVAPEADPSYADPIKRVAVAYDGTVSSELALGAAAGLATFLAAELELVAVAEPAPAEVAGIVRDRLRAGLERAAARLPEERRGGTVLLEGEPGPEIVRAASRDVGLLVLGSRGYGPDDAVVAGRVGWHVVDHAPCPVLVVRRPSSLPAAAA